MANSLSFYNISLKTLNSFFVSFKNFIVYGDIISGFEFWKLFFSSQLFVYKCYCRVHNINFWGGKSKKLLGKSQKKLVLANPYSSLLQNISQSTKNGLPGYVHSPFLP